jgi:hypothetical protein
MIDTALASAVRARKLPSMGRAATVFALTALLAGCDMAERDATAAAGAETAAREAAAARGTENRVREQIGSAYQRAAEQREAQEMDGR